MTSEKESLENTLKQVESLKKDLSATITVRQEQGHYEDRWQEPTIKMGNWPTEMMYWIDENDDSFSGKLVPEWIVDVRGIYEPDIEARERARQQLQEIYNGSDWYSARYFAGIALLIEDNQLRGKLNLWIKSLKKQIRTKISGEKREKISQDLNRLREEKQKILAIHRKSGEKARVMLAFVMVAVCFIGFACYVGTSSIYFKMFLIIATLFFLLFCLCLNFV